MNFFPLRRRDAALSELKVPDAVFLPLEPEDDDASPPAAPPETSSPVSPANALVTELIERDIVAAVMADCAPAAEAMEMPAPLSRRHLDTIERMVAHLRADEKRLEAQISDARKALADTRLARRGYERSGAYLRRGIGALIRNDVSALSAAPPPQDDAAGREMLQPPEAANGLGTVAEIAAAAGERRQMH